jgi:hypothetical protein
MNFLHERDLGDIILSLASVQAAGGGNYYIQNNPTALRLLRPLIEYQPYIKKFGHKLLFKIDKSFVDFRKNGHPYGVPLAELHARWIKQHTDLNKQWLFCPKDKKFKDRVIVNKTNRYANPLFPWKEIVDKISESILFVGHDSEYELFCKRFGKVERLIVKDYLELAIAINSSECFIGNQSSANCVAEGLKHRTIQEVCLWMPDCIYKRDNAIFCYNGKIDTVLSEKSIQVSDKTPERHIDKTQTPSGGWRLTINGKKLNSYSIDVLAIQAQSAGLEKPKSEIEKMIIAETAPFIAIDPITERLLASIRKVKELIG